MSEARGLPTVEELQREYQAKLTQAARAQFTSADLVNAWLAFAEPQVVKSSFRTWRMCASRLLAFLDETGEHVLNMDRASVNRYASWVETAPYPGRRKKGKLSAGAVRQHIQQGSSLFNHLVERGLASVNPFFFVDRQFKKKRRAELCPELRALDERETALLLEDAETLEDFLLVLLPFKTLARREELAGIRMERIDWKARTITIDPHPKRTYLKLYFDEETEYFLRLKCERNKRDHPGNPYLWPSPNGTGRHMTAHRLSLAFKEIVQRSPLAATITDKGSNVTMHTGRRSGTSVLKRARPSCPTGVPPHVVAIIRGDSLRARSENTPDPTQGIYTKMGKVEGIDEVRWWYDRGMPKLGAREAWARAVPTRKTAVDVAGLIRAAKSGGVRAGNSLVP